MYSRKCPVVTNGLHSLEKKKSALSDRQPKKSMLPTGVDLSSCELQTEVSQTREKVMNY